MKKERKQLNIRIPEKELQLLKIYAEEQGHTITGIIRELIRERLGIK